MQWGASLAVRCEACGDVQALQWRVGITVRYEPSTSRCLNISLSLPFPPSVALLRRPFLLRGIRYPVMRHVPVSLQGCGAARGDGDAVRETRSVVLALPAPPAPPASGLSYFWPLSALATLALLAPRPRVTA
jgi:hypothetical protein